MKDTSRNMCNKTIFRNVTIFFINLYKGFDKSLWEIMKIQNCPSQLKVVKVSLGFFFGYSVWWGFFLVETGVL